MTTETTHSGQWPKEVGKLPEIKDLSDLTALIIAISSISGLSLLAWAFKRLINHLIDRDRDIIDLIRKQSQLFQEVIDSLKGMRDVVDRKFDDLQRSVDRGNVTIEEQARTLTRVVGELP